MFQWIYFFTDIPRKGEIDPQRFHLAIRYLGKKNNTNLDRKGSILNYSKSCLLKQDLRSF